MDRHTRRAALFLLLTPGPLAEVLSQNVQLSTFLQPVPFLLVTLTYGVPVLVIRELSVARKLNDAGLVLLGLAYGILNEGVLAKTLTLPAGAPLHDFVGYGQIGVMQGGWSIFIIAWHALHSVLYPILLTRWMFPAAANRRWFDAGHARWALRALLILVAGLYSLYFLNPVRNEPAVFALYAAATAGLLAAALTLCKRRDSAALPAAGASPSLWMPPLLGGCMIIFYLFQFWAPAHVPFAMYVAISLGAFFAVTAALIRGRWPPLPAWLLFGLGDYTTFCIFAALLCVVTDRNPMQSVVAMTILVAGFLWLFRAVVRAPFGRAMPG